MLCNLCNKVIKKTLFCEKLNLVFYVMIIYVYIGSIEKRLAFCQILNNSQPNRKLLIRIFIFIFVVLITNALKLITNLLIYKYMHIG